MSSKLPSHAEPSVIPYRSPDVPPPVTRAERITVLSGYALLAGGLLALPWLMDRTEGRSMPLWLASAAIIAGAGITAFCYIANALRRM